MKFTKKTIRELILEALEKNLFKKGEVEKYDLGGKKFKNVKPALNSKNIEKNKSKFKFDPNDAKITNQAKQAFAAAFSKRMK